MMLDIKRIDVNDSMGEKFYTSYIATEIPLVITNCKIGDQITPAYVRSKYMDEKKRDIGWYDAPLPGPEDPIVLPQLVKDVFARDDIVSRPCPMRVWLQPGGHRTLFHYDGNSLCGFNLQVQGHKRWTLISPNAELRCMPFNFVLMLDESFQPDSTLYDVYSFETGPGDMLYLPRYWIHGVESLETVNLNVNWVWTPNFPNTNSKLGRRETELLRLRQALPILNRIMGDGLKTYGGGGEVVVEKYVHTVGLGHALRCLISELCLVPYFLLRIPSILRQIRVFSKNNFNVK